MLAIETEELSEKFYSLILVLMGSNRHKPLFTIAVSYMRNTTFAHHFCMQEIIESLATILLDVILHNLLQKY
jgi:hypothetical protein